VPADATAVVFGVLLRGSGSVSARHLRLDASGALSADAPIAAPAKEVLDAALSITKKDSLHRRMLNACRSRSPMLLLKLLSLLHQCGNRVRPPRQA
jgi:hypothetical protein